MNILTLENIEKTFLERKVFDGANFYLQDGEKVGIIGINGTGKSTLLHLIAGTEEADAGRIVRAGHVVIRMLPQQPIFPAGKTILSCVIDPDHAVENGPTEADAKIMLNRLGLTDHGALADTLSGGQKKRLALAKVLLTPADILLLDEPTNHLDQEMADWLEGYLRDYRGTLVMVTHDRYFLDSICSRIVELDKGVLYSYDTNYAGYLELKAERLSMAEASERKRQSILRTELAWIQRGARARSTKQKARIERYEELKNRKGPEEELRTEMSSSATRMGRTTVELSGLQKSYDGTVYIRDFSYIFLKNDRIGFIGPNGCGKTTLMKMIAGREMPDSGTIVIGQTIKIGYYTQEFENSSDAGIAYMDPEKKVIDYIRDTAEFIRTDEGTISASKMLERFLFNSEMQYGRIGKLSGGEKRRLNLLRVLMESPNVLILDEPTNDLDIATLELLEDYLDAFPGIVITVSHDRYFLDRVVRRIFAFEEDGNIRQYEGGYSDWRLRKEFESPEGIALREAVKKPAEEPKKAATNSHEKKLKMTFKEQKEYESIEGEIASLEERIAELETEIAANARDYSRLSDLMKEKEEKEAYLEERMDRWMELEELAAMIRAEKA